MAKVARSLVDVVLGEAVSGTRAQRYDDMRAIASAVVNRAAETRATIDDVISAQGQFDAYGRSLPPGVDKFRDLAEQAIADVLRNGPTHAGSFYATPSATKNLPSGLQPVTQTAGHQFFADPHNRAIATRQGYVTPNKAYAIAPQQTASLFDRLASPLESVANSVTNTLGGLYSRFSPSFEPDVPTQPASRPVGLEALAPNGLISPTTGTLTYDLENARRSQVPTSGIGAKVHAAANSVIPGIDTSLYSGMEPAGSRRVGAPNRHPLGFAGDFTFSKAGQQITDPVAMHDIAMAMAAQHNANIGYSGVPGVYMGPGRMHIDTMPLDRFPGGAQWGPTAKSWAGNLEFARQTGIGPTPYSNAPTPTSRNAALTEMAQIANEQTARAQLGQSLAQAGVSLGGKRTATAPSVEQANANRFDKMTAAPQGQKTANAFDKMKAGMTATPQASASSFDAMKAGMDRLAAATRAAPATPSQPSPDYAGFESRRAQAFSGLPAAPSPASTPTASISPASIAALGALTAPATASINPTAISATPASLTTPRPSVAPISVTPTAVARVTPPTVAPVTPARVAPRTVSVPAAPARRAAAISAPAPAPTPSFRAADVYSGLAPVGAQGVATGGNTVSRDKYGNISVGNQFGATTTTTPGGRQAADLSGFFGGGFGDFGAPGSLGGLGGRLGKAAPGIIGGMIGNAVAGPVGGILGAMLGNRVAASRAIGLDTYPDAPSPARGNRSSSTGKSRGELSDRARSDIDRGKGGLY